MNMGKTVRKQALLFLTVELRLGEIKPFFNQRFDHHGPLTNSNVIISEQGLNRLLYLSEFEEFLGVKKGISQILF